VFPAWTESADKSFRLTASNAMSTLSGQNGKPVS